MVEDDDGECACGVTVCGVCRAAEAANEPYSLAAEVRRLFQTIEDCGDLDLGPICGADGTVLADFSRGRYRLIVAGRELVRRARRGRIAAAPARLAVVPRRPA